MIKLFILVIMRFKSSQHRNDCNHVVLFEPWGLGDLAISLSGLRCLAEQGGKLSVICDPPWVDWARSLPWVSEVIPFHAPWTEKEDKYSLRKYDLSEIWRLRQKLLSARPDFMCEVRTDIRNKLFLHLLHVAPVVTLKNQAFCNRYDRPAALAKLLGFSPSTHKHERVKDDRVVCFFGAAWTNRRVPIFKAREIVRRLLAKLSCAVTVILQPDDDLSEWDEIAKLEVERFSLLKSSIIGVNTVISSANVAICTDSSWLHIAHAQGIPTVGLFGFDNDDEWAPPGCTVIHSNCVFPAISRYKLAYEEICPLETLDASFVIQKVDELLTCSMEADGPQEITT